MACAGLLLASLLAAVTSGLNDAARPPVESSASSTTSSPRTIVSKPIDLSVAGAIHGGAAAPSADLPSTSTGSWDETEARPGISVGPLHTQFGGVAGLHMHLATVRLEGVSAFGGSIGGSIDSRSARITLTWPTSP